LRLPALRQPQWRKLCLGALLLALHAAAAADESEKSALWRKAEKTLGIRVLLPSTGSLHDLPVQGVTFTPIGPAESADAAYTLRLFIEEFSKYPPSLLRRVNLEWVAFVKRLKVENDPRMATYVRHFAPVTMKPAGGMIYDVQQGSTHEAYVRWVLHHEFFHFIDHHLNRSLEDRQWLALNPPMFRYAGSHGVYSPFLDHPRRGAITTYSMKSVWEDRAEIFAALHADENRSPLKVIAESDAVARKKIRRMMALLRRMGPNMNEAHFRRRLGAAGYEKTRH
jgi:hypothetical protein